MKRTRLVLLCIMLVLGSALLVMQIFPSKDAILPFSFNHRQSISQSAKHPVYYQNQAVVLLYHDISEPECGTSISPERFAGHLRMLEREGFAIVSLEDIKSFLRAGNPLPANAVAITLDDACVSNYKTVFPALQSRNWPFAVFVTVSEVGKTRPNGLDRRLTWQEAKEMASAGVVVGSHTYNGHKKWKNQQGQAYWLTNQQSYESGQAYQQRVLTDLKQSRARLQQETNQEVLDFAPPFGAYNATAINLARQAGYQYIWTTHPAAVRRSSSPNALGRVSVGIKGTNPQQLKTRILQVAGSSE